MVAKICDGDARSQGERYHNRFVETLKNLNDTLGNPFKVAVSFGVYSASLSGIDTIDSLIELADRLMYNDKAKYKRRPRSLPPV